MFQNINISTADRENIGVVKSKTWLKEARKMWMLYLFLLLPIIHTIIFHYLPMYGVVIAFKNFKPVDGILGSKWNNFRHFRDLFTSTGFF